MNNAAMDLVARALDRSISDVPTNGTIETVPGWDSLGHVKVLLLLEAELGRLLMPAEIATIRSVSDIDRILGAAVSR
ncbi:MAG: acyl carrier protein [Xanthobacteraceae bacterium]